MSAKYLCALIVSILVMELGMGVLPAMGQNAEDGAKGEKPKVHKALAPFVGEWEVKGSEFDAHTGKTRPFTVIESIQPILNGKFILGRAYYMKRKDVALWVMGYDDKSGQFSFRYFNGAGMNGEWIGKAEGKHKVTFKAKDLPPGWSGMGLNDFTDKKKPRMGLVFKDDGGNVMAKIDGTKTLRKNVNEKEFHKTWMKKGRETGTSASSEMKKMRFLFGQWKGTLKSYIPGRDNNDASQSGMFTSMSALGGHIVINRTRMSNFKHFSVITYNRNRGAYVGYGFTSNGVSVEMQGTWQSGISAVHWKVVKPSDRKLTSLVRPIAKNVITNQLVGRNDEGKLTYEVNVRWTKVK